MTQSKKKQTWIQIPEDKLFCVRIPLYEPNTLELYPMKSRFVLWLYLLSAWGVYLWSLYQWDFEVPKISADICVGRGDFWGALVLLLTTYLCRTMVELWVARRQEVTTSALSLQIHGVIPTLHYELQTKDKKSAIYTHLGGLSTVALGAGLGCMLESDIIAAVGTMYLVFHCCIFFPNSVSRRIVFVLLGYKPSSFWTHIQVLATTENEDEMFRHCSYILYNSLAAIYGLVWILLLFLRPACRLAEVIL